MFSWLKQFGSRKQPVVFAAQDRWWATEFPDWAQSMGTPERFHAFMDGVVAYFAKRGLSAHVHPSGVVHPDPNHIEKTWGLGNLLQTCATRQSEEFPGLIAAHFDLLERADTQGQQLALKLNDWEYARPRLRIRLWDTEVREALAKTITRESIPGLITALSVDLPEAIQTVSHDLAKKWDKTPVELFDIARENTWDAVHPAPKLLDAANLGNIHVVEDDSYYTASIALQIDRLPTLLGPHGVFISVPTRGGMLALPFNRMADLQFLAHLVRFTRHCFEQGPGSVSYRIWWYRTGTWHEIPYESDPERISILPPIEFEKYVSTIAPEESDEPDGPEDSDPSDDPADR
ncbi:MAG: hypothetical protein JNM86_12025 [Phycisphaerae bacterium]|nr:hypothetical protein [Phycisphaerae bacterium]